MVCAFVFMVSTALIGDLSGKYLAKYQPEKLAATEWHFETMGKAPLVLGGVLTEDNQVRFGLEIPFGLSILAHSNPFAEVIGLNEFPEDERPPLWIHYLFDIKMGYVAFMVLVSLLFLVEMIRKKGNTYRRWLLRTIVVAAPVAILTIEHGWIFSEVGRQPWILRGIMRTSEGATTSGHVDLMLWLFALLYLVLGVSSVRVLVKMFRNNQAEDELAKYDKEARDLL